MVIKSLICYRGDLELRWIDGYIDHSGKGPQVIVQFLNHDNDSTFVKELPFSLLPLLTPGLVVSRGEVQIARRTGREFRVILEDLSQPEEIRAHECDILNNHYRIGQGGSSQRILRYRVGSGVYLIPAVELIRFLFLHDRILAEHLLLPSGLMNLAVVPLPGCYRDILLEFTDRVPRKVVTFDFVNEFAWLAVDAGGRSAWDSVRKRSLGEHFFTFDPPPLRSCCIEFRGLEYEGEWLVLEILSISGRLLPAETITWTHPSVYEKSPRRGIRAVESTQRPRDDKSRSHRKREYVADEVAGSRKNTNQDVLLLGGKRGSFANRASVVKLARNRTMLFRTGIDAEPRLPRDTRPCAAEAVDPKLMPTVMRQAASIGEIAFSNGLPPVDFSVLAHAPWTEIGNLGLLNETLQRVERSFLGLTLTRGLYYLNYGSAFSYCGQRRRTYLMAVFTAPNCHPRVLIDVDHTGGDGLSALFLRYDVPTPSADVASHVNEIMNGLVWNYGHWNILTESRLSQFVTIKRLPRLLRMLDRSDDKEYVGRWVRRLHLELRWQQLSLDNDWTG